MTRVSAHIRGFTLIEVITVLAVLSVISTMGTMAYLRVDQHWRAAHTRTVLHATADAIFAQMRKDIDGMLSPMRSGAVLRGEDARFEVTDEGDRYFRAAFADDRCIIPIEVYDPLRKSAVRMQLTYRIDRDAQPPRLVRETRPLTPGDGSGDAPDPKEAAPALRDSATGTLDLNIEYLRDGLWRDQWDGPGAPNAIRVSITVLDARRPYEQVSRMTVIPVHVD